MGFDDLVQRMGKRHGISPGPLADPATLARQSQRHEYRMMIVFGVGLIVVVLALAVGLAMTGWTMMEATGMLIFGGGAAISHGVQGLRSLR